MDPMPVTGNPVVDHWLAIIGLVMSVASAAASFLNGKVRDALDAGEEIPSLFLYTALVINSLAFNIDKAGQMQRLLRGQSVMITRMGPADVKKDGAP